MSSTSNILFFSGETSLTVREWEQIVHSLVTYGNVMWLHAESEFSPNLAADVSDKILGTYNELRDAKRIRTWELEASITRASSRGTSGDRIITTEEHRSLYESINFAVLEKSAVVVESVPQKREVERTSKLIEFRQELWDLGIATLCGSGSIVYQRISPKSPPYSSYYRYEQLNKKYTRYLFRKFRLPSLYLLTAEDILELQKTSSALRSKVDSFISSRISDVGIADQAIAEDCDKLYDEYLATMQKAIAEKSKKGAAKGVTKDAVVGATGLFLPILAVLPVAEKLGAWFKNKGKYAFLLYMVELQARAFKAFKQN